LQRDDLLARLRERIFRFAASRLQRDAAEDLAQEVLLVLHEKYAALDRVEMGTFRDRLIGDLSGGQQQRVFIARALATEPDIIFLDEPTVGVEKHIRDEFYALLKQLNRALCLTVVLITHDLESVAYEAMHVACIDRALYYYDSAEAFLRERRPTDHAHR